MRNTSKTIMVAILALMMVALVSSCGGGGGGGTSAVTTTSTDSGSAEGYAYTTVEGDSLVASRAAGRVDGRISSFIPLAGASVVCEGRTTTTNAFGYYKLTGIPTGSRSLTITKSGYLPIKVIITIISNQTVTATDQDSEDTALQPSESGSISVTSTPSGATIFLDGQATDFTTPNTLDKISAGSHDVHVALDGYDTPAVNTVVVAANQTVSADFTLTASVETDDSSNSDTAGDDSDSDTSSNDDSSDSGNNTPVPSAANYVIVDSAQSTCYSASQWMARRTERISSARTPSTTACSPLTRTMATAR